MKTTRTVRTAVMMMAAIALLTGAAKAAVIPVVDVYGHNERINYAGTIDDMIIGSGMNTYGNDGNPGWPAGEGDPSTWTATSNAYQAEWQCMGTLDPNTSINGKIAWTAFDLGSVTSGLDKFHIWNEREREDRSVDQYNVYYAATPTTALVHGPTGGSSNNDYDFSSAGWTQLGSTASMPFRSGSDGGAAQAVLDLGGASAQYLAVEILSNRGWDGRTGWAEGGSTPTAGGGRGPPPPLKVDFNSTSQDNGAHNQAGFEPYDARHEVAADFDTKTYSAFGTTVSVTPDWPNTSDRRVRQMIDRGAGNDNNWDNTDGDVDLVTDWLGIDTRTGNGGNGNWDGTTGTPTYMTLSLGGLPVGAYDWKSFHHDTENVHGDFAAWISTDGGTTWVPLPDGLMTDSTPGGNPSSSGFDPPGPWTGPDADLLPSTYLASFLADGVNDVVFRFAPYANTAVNRQLWGINGFELTQQAEVPEPATMALLGLAACGLGGYVRRRRRA